MCRLFAASVRAVLRALFMRRRRLTRPLGAAEVAQAICRNAFPGVWIHARLAVHEQTTWRAGLTWFFFRRTGILSLVYGETYRENDPTNPLKYPVERTVNLESRFRF